jgi:tetratricopeptide (TPR) repeat protein
MFHARFAEGSKEAPVAAKHWKQAIELDPERPAYVTRYLQLLLNARAEREAEVESERAVRRFPKHAELHRLRALALYSQGRTQDAIDSFLCAIDLEPGNEAHYASLETLLSDAGARISEIVQRLDALAAADTQSPLPLYLKALCLPEQAPTLLRRAIELEASFWPAYFELQKLAPNPQERIRLLEKVVALHPTYAPAYYALAQTHAIIGNREAARQAREQHHRFSK